MLIIDDRTTIVFPNWNTIKINTAPRYLYKMVAQNTIGKWGLDEFF